MRGEGGQKREREGGRRRRDTEAEIGDGPVSQTVFWCSMHSSVYFLTWLLFSLLN